MYRAQRLLQHRQIGFQHALEKTPHFCDVTLGASDFELLEAPSQLVRVRVEVSHVVERVPVRGVEIDQTRHLFRMARADRAQLLAGERVAGEHRHREVKRIDDGQHVVRETVGLVSRLGFARRAEAAPSDADDVIVRRERRSELIEGVRRQRVACKQNDGSAGAAPIEHLELDVRLDRDKPRRLSSANAGNSDYEQRCRENRRARIRHLQIPRFARDDMD